jgi:hypothetical protein
MAKWANRRRRAIGATVRERRGMENRRETYRHAFAPWERVSVELSAPGQRSKWTGELVDLSLGGLAIRLQENDRLPPPRGPVTAQFLLPGETDPLTIQSFVTHWRRDPDSCTWGIHFLPLPQPKAEAGRSKTLWRVLLEEQRQALRQDHAETTAKPHLTIYHPPEESDV